MQTKKKEKKQNLHTSNIKYIKAETVRQALGYADKFNGKAKFIAGGTDLLVNNYQGNSLYEYLIDLNGINELKEVKLSNDNVSIGSMVKLRDLSKSNILTDSFPALIEAANSVGTPLIRNSATIGGNLLCDNRCYFYNQTEWWRESIGYCLKCEGDVCVVTGTDKACYSEFVSDTAPVLISLNAEIEIESNYKVRRTLLENIYTGDGIKPVSLKNNELIKTIFIPAEKHIKTFYRKLRQRESLEFTWLTIAVTIFRNDNIKIVLGGVDPKPVVINDKIGADTDTIIKSALKQARTVNNNMSTRTYRREMIKNILSEELNKFKLTELR